MCTSTQICSHSLGRDSVVQQLVAYVADPIPPGASDVRRYKYPYMATEVFCCEVPAILSAAVDNTQHLAALVSILDQPPDTLDPHQAGYFEKVLMLLLRYVLLI